MENQLSDNVASSVGPSCGDTRCNSHGTCVLPADGGDDLRCDCALGYRGSFCEQTFNGSLSMLLTLSTIGIILALVVLAFVVARLRRNKKKQLWQMENEMRLSKPREASTYT